MSRFVAPDLSQLGDLPLPTVDFDTAEARRLEFYKAALTAHEIEYDVESLLTDPMRVALANGGAYVENLTDQRIVEAIRALSLAQATGAALDHIGATYYGVSRAQILDDDGNAVVDDDGNVVLEDDERLRARIALAPEAFSTAGPRGAYIFHALELDGIADLADASAYGEEDEAVYSADVLFADAYTEGKRSTPFEARETGDPVIAPEILLSVLPALSYGAADSALLTRVFDAVTPEDVRPLGDNVRVEAAEVIDYTLDLTLAFGPGADTVTLLEAARTALTVYTLNRRRVGVAAQPTVAAGIAYAASSAALVTITGSDADIGGGQKQAPNCTAINLTAVEAVGSWQIP